MYSIKLDTGKILHIAENYGWYIDGNLAGDEDNSIYSSKLVRELDWYSYLRNYNIYVSANCNGKCLYCYQDAQEKRTIENLSFDDIKNYINYIESINDARTLPKSIELFGGEPLLRKDIHKILDYILDRGYSVKIATNGTLPIIQSKAMLKYIKNSNIHFRISLDGHTQELHEKYRTKNTFYKIIDNIKYLVGNGAEISLKTIVTNHNFKYLKDILHYFKYDLGVKLWNYNALYVLDSTIKNNIESTITHYTLVEELTKDEYKEYWDMFIQTPLAQMLKSIYVKKIKKYRRTYLFLNYDKNLYLNDQLIFPEYSIGNSSCLDFEKMKMLVSEIEMNRKSCENCFAKDYCFLGNYGELYNIDKSLSTEFPTCDQLRKAVIHIMSLEEKGLHILKTIYKIS
ncbi:radical SAM protein [Clostridium isatidis]|jgi:sulfatase maturation enzyme AslB (radical SAM superfamily)|uniref:Radical SAM core domain-containing protein n=2 Tax=Clostridiaceae TaxID=31979 RepID=A0A343J951_9CLOT|nr:radical SAM protein [Clostridium isatidis]ASW42059.1 hypothetical protein BEN51_00610 [Clostridium isatidis]